MRRRKRLALPAAALVALVAVGWFVLWLRPGRITRENFDRIRVGMPRADVEALLGPPGNYLTGPVADSPQVWGDPARVSLPGVSWRSDDGIISIKFNYSGKVVEKLFVPVVRLEKEPVRLNYQPGPADIGAPSQPTDPYGPSRYSR
jgi:hypothetical protein